MLRCSSAQQQWLKQGMHFKLGEEDEKNENRTKRVTRLEIICVVYVLLWYVFPLLAGWLLANVFPGFWSELFFQKWRLLPKLMVMAPTSVWMSKNVVQLNSIRLRNKNNFNSRYDSLEIAQEISKGAHFKNTNPLLRDFVWSWKTGATVSSPSFDLGVVIKRLSLCGNSKKAARTAAKKRLNTFQGRSVNSLRINF